MTQLQREQITQLRRAGHSYSDIGRHLGLSKDTVKSYCRRNSLLTIDLSHTVASDTCRQCGAPIEQQPKKKRRVFCCKTCREKWWKEHPEEVRRKANYTFNCAGCGRTFTAYGNDSRKYCSHACYIQARFGGGLQHE